MTTGPLTLNVLAATLTVARLPADADRPDWIEGGRWYSMTRTSDELSVVCESRLVPAGARQSGPWRALQVEGPLDFSLTGILYRIAGPLAGAGISLFAVSTFDTDYVLVGEADLERAAGCLRDSGIIVRPPV